MLCDITPCSLVKFRMSLFSLNRGRRPGEQETNMKLALSRTYLITDPEIESPCCSETSIDIDRITRRYDQVMRNMTSNPFREKGAKNGRKRTASSSSTSLEVKENCLS
jgi:hypothetical protein